MCKKEPLCTFAERRPDNPNADRKKIDYAYLAVHHAAMLAEQIAARYRGAGDTSKAENFSCAK
jgi:hypothetical protein